MRLAGLGFFYFWAQGVRSLGFSVCRACRALGLTGFIGADACEVQGMSRKPPFSTKPGFGSEANNTGALIRQGSPLRLD